MLEKFVGEAISSAPGLAGIAYEAIEDGNVRLVMEAPELGRRIYVQVDQSFDDGIDVLRMHTVRLVEGEPEPPGEVIQQGLAELRRRWPEIMVQIRNTREGVNLEYETRIVRRRAADLGSGMDLKKDFVTVLPRLRDCVVRSFIFINVLCVASQVDVRLLEGAQDFALEEWEFVQECGGLDSMRQRVDELCGMLDASRDDVLSAALIALRRQIPRAPRAEAVVPAPAVDSTFPEADVAGHAVTTTTGVAAEPIGLTLEELIQFGP